MIDARFWHTTDTGAVQCDLCPHGCVLEDDQAGLCGVRQVRNGRLQAIAYGRVSSAHVDPMEKKPLYHFHPASAILSVGGWGCNLACLFCQNWSISQKVLLNASRHSPESMISRAIGSGSVGLAYTYNEPIVGFEFVDGCARRAKAKGLANVLVTNGYIQTEAAAELLQSVDALNIDIKSMDDAFYRKYCKGSLQPVLDFAVQAVDAGCHLEITNLVIPSLNDDEDRIEELALWIAENLGQDIALHLSAYRPEYKMTLPPTPTDFLERAHAICREHLSYVYVGNAMTRVGQNTECPHCGETLISRIGYSISVCGIEDGQCKNCHRPANVVM